MKILIKNTILAVVVFLGLFLVGCEKSNVEPDYTTTEGLITISTEADSVLVHIHTSKGEAVESEFKVYKGEPKNIELKGFDPKNYRVWVNVMTYKDMYNSFIKGSSVKVIDHKNREVSYSHNGRVSGFGSDFIYVASYYFTFTE